MSWWATSGDATPVLQHLTAELDTALATESVHRNQEIAVIALFAGKLEIAESALRRVRASSPDDPIAFNLLGELHLERGEYDDAESVYTGLAEAMRQQESFLSEAAARSNLAMVYIRTERYEEAERELDAAVAIYEERNGSASSRARVYGKLGILARHREKLDDALSWHRKALDLYETMGDEEGRARELSGMALVHSEYGDKENLQIAERLLHESLKIEKTLRRPLGIAKDTLSLGAVKVRQNDWEAAEPLLRDAADRFRRLQNRNGEARARFNLANVLVQRQRYEAALKELKQARDLFREIELNSMVQIAEKRIQQVESALIPRTTTSRGADTAPTTRP